MNSQTFKQIAASYIQLITLHEAEEKKIDDKIDKKQQQLTRLLVCKKKMKPYPWWTEHLLRPVINQIKIHLPYWICDDERLTPMGLSSRVSVFFTSKFDSKKYIYLVFVPGNLLEGQLSYETGKSNNRFAKNTIGEINGFYRITKPVESIEELVSFLNQQIENK